MVLVVAPLSTLLMAWALLPSAPSIVEAIDLGPDWRSWTPSRPSLTRSILMFLVYSPLLSWAFLLPGSLLALALAWRGQAGWLPALVAGTLAGPLAQGVGLLVSADPALLAEASLGTGLTPLQEMLPMAVTGGVLALAFWTGVRLARPRLFARTANRPG